LGRFRSQPLDGPGKRALFIFEESDLTDVRPEERTGQTGPVVFAPLTDLRRHRANAARDIDDQGGILPDC
jgi:hypothetical protein